MVGSSIWEGGGHCVKCGDVGKDMWFEARGAEVGREGFDEYA